MDVWEERIVGEAPPWDRRRDDSWARRPDGVGVGGAGRDAPPPLWVPRGGEGSRRGEEGMRGAACEAPPMWSPKREGRPGPEQRGEGQCAPWVWRGERARGPACEALKWDLMGAERPRSPRRNQELEVGDGGVRDGARWETAAQNLSLGRDHHLRSPRRREWSPPRRLGHQVGHQVPLQSPRRPDPFDAPLGRLPLRGDVFEAPLHRSSGEQPPWRRSPSRAERLCSPRLGVWEAPPRSPIAKRHRADSFVQRAVRGTGFEGGLVRNVAAWDAMDTAGDGWGRAVELVTPEFVEEEGGKETEVHAYRQGPSAAGDGGRHASGRALCSRSASAPLVKGKSALTECITMNRAEKKSVTKARVRVDRSMLGTRCRDVKDAAERRMDGV